MRKKALLLGDIRFQLKYGFYGLYLIFCTLYLVLLHLLPAAWRPDAAVLMIFSDPAAMGLFFMGAIVLFEKSERTINSIAISPVSPAEYVCSKLLSIGMISTAAGLAIGIGGGLSLRSAFFLPGVFLGSCLFSAVGLMVAANIGSLNQFVVATIPAELLINLPAMAWLLGWRPRWLLLHPGVCIIELCFSGESSPAAFLLLLVWTAFAAALASAVTARSFQSLGGVK